MMEIGFSRDDRQALLEARRRELERQRQEELQRQREAEAARKREELAKALEAQRATDKLTTKGSGPLENAGHLEMGELPWAAEDREAKAARDSKFPTITKADVEADPELGKQLAAMREIDDPDVQLYLKDTAEAMVKDTLKQSLQEKQGEEVFKTFQDDMTNLSSQTGLGEVFKSVSADAVKGVARDLLNDGVDAQAIVDNPAKGRLLATLKDDADPAVRKQLNETVKGWTDEALKQSLKGREGKIEVREGIDDFHDKLSKMAQDTGLGEVFTKQAAASMKDENHHIEKLRDKGKNLFEKAFDVATDVVGKRLIQSGKDMFHATEHVVDALEVVKDAGVKGLKGSFEMRGNALDGAIDMMGKGAKKLANLEADALEALGADRAADAVRDGGKTMDKAMDKVGDWAKKSQTVQGEILGGAVELVGGLVGGTVDMVGDIGAGVLSTAGLVSANGPVEAATKLADDKIGPVQAEYAGQLHGPIGMVTDRLGKGDSVFLNIDGGLEVGVGVFAGGKLNGSAILGRDGKGNITLTVGVGADGEVGVSAETGGEVGIGNQVSVKAEAEAKASVTGQIQGKITLKFDPHNPEDLARMKALLEPASAQPTDKPINPLKMAKLPAKAWKDAIENNVASTEVYTSSGVKVGANGEISVGKKHKADAKAVKLASAKVGAEWSAVGSTTEKHNADGTTEMTLNFREGYKLDARVSVGEYGVGARKQGAKVDGVTVKTDEDGNIVGLKVEETKSKNSSATVSVKNASGTPANGTTVKVEHALTEQGLEEARELIEKGATPIEAFEKVAGKAGNSTDNTITIDADTYTLGIRVKASVMGVKAKVDGSSTVGKMHVEAENGGEPTSEDMNLILGRF